MKKISFLFFLFVLTFQTLLQGKLLATSELYQAQLIYENYFGDYYVGWEKIITIDLKKDSPAHIAKYLKEIDSQAKAGVLLIGYGAGEQLIDNYFAATKDLNKDEPLIQTEPFKNFKAVTNGVFYLRIVHPFYSSFAEKGAEKHIPLSPLAHLPLIAEKVTFF